MPSPRDDLATFAVAPVPDGANGWRRLITGIDDSRTGAFAITGQKLHPGGCYSAHHGTLIVAVDAYPDHRDIQLLAVHPGGLAALKTWRQKVPLGARVVTAVKKHLPGAPTHTAAPLAGVPNRRPARCCYCDGMLGVGQGRVVQMNNGAIRITHPDKCPPIKTTRNERDGHCTECSKPVPARAGVIYRVWDTLTSTSRWAIRHETPTDCSAAPLYSPNKWDDWCSVCHRTVRAGAGLVVNGAAQHLENTCTESVIPMWRITRGLDNKVSYGDTLRVTLKHRRSDQEVPDTAPGWAVLNLGMTSVVVTVVDTQLLDTHQAALVRVATWDHAAPILAEEVELAIDAQPNPRGFKAAFAAERIGDGPGSAPWLAEIVGHDPTYGYRRAFLPPRRDYLGSNSRCTRGVMYRWILSPSSVYEAYTPTSWNRSRRFFLRVTPDGDTEEVTSAQVDARLRHGLEMTLASDTEEV